ncbi:MAG: hypothetical protein Q7T88_12455 [Methylotenera sp.]|nr:hypothetical protein [Methylotenera sp.]
MGLDYFALLVSILSALIAVIAILRANEANCLAAEANRIAKHYNLRPIQLNACNLVKDFSHYCTTYRTVFLQKMVSGTKELMDRRDAFKFEFEKFGPLEMPSVELKVSELLIKAAQLQRALDRSRGSDPKPLDSKYTTLEENIDAIADWFAEDEKTLPSLFKQYLDDA